nr:NirD/YgiW/YdeI family stress tolerance protein [Chromobacterium sp. ASV5]
MKMKLSAVLLAAAFLPFAAYAEFTGPGAVAPLTNAAAVDKAADDAPVTLEGKIVRQLHHEHYEFRDAGGKTVTVEIDRKRLPAEKFDQNTRLRIHGKVDKEWNGRKIDVKRVEILR